MRSHSNQMACHVEGRVLYHWAGKTHLVGAAAGRFVEQVGHADCQALRRATVLLGMVVQGAVVLPEAHLGLVTVVGAVVHLLDAVPVADGLCSELYDDMK